MVTVKDIMRIEAFNKIDFLAGKSGLNRQVRWPYICQNLDVEKWVQGSEILFMTGVGMKMNENSLKQFIYKCYISNISGIIILPSPDYIPVIPNSVIAACNKFAIPLFSMPWDIPMIHVTKSISDYLYANNKDNKIDRGLFEKMIKELNKKDRTIGEIISEIHLPKFDHYVLIIINGRSKNEQTHSYAKFISENFLRTGLFAISGCLIYFLAELDTNIDHTFFLNIIRYFRVKTHNNSTIFIGYSNKLSLKSSLNQSVMEAKCALWAGQLNNQTICSYRNSGIIKLFAQCRLDSLNEYFSNILEPIILYDQKHQTALLETIECFLKSNCNYKSASELLFIHRNTLTYRIEKIEELLNCNFKDPQDIYNLTTALLTRQFYSNRLDTQ
ncbi:PucR family transcriptional regulator [Sporolactobacillus nakayamae]|nr:PucR family transcriptional regulator [Sporolactobacillus nakayamae]